MDCAHFECWHFGVGCRGFFFLRFKLTKERQSSQRTLSELEKLRIQAERSAALVDLGNWVARENTLEEAGDRCLATAIKVSGADAGVVYLFDKRRNEVRVVAEAGFSDNVDRKLNSHLIVATNPKAVFESSVYFGSYKQYVKERMITCDDKIEAKGIAVLPLVEDSRVDLCLQLYSYSQSAFEPSVRAILEDMRCLVWIGLERLLSASSLSESLALSSARSRAMESILENLGVEVRTSMQNILGSAEVLGVSELNPVQDGLVRIMTETSLGLLETVSHVIDFSVMAKGALVLSESDVNLSVLVQDVVQLFRQRAGGRQIELASVVDSRLPNIVVCDGERVRQILINLINVALRYSLQTKIVVSVSPQIGVSEDLFLRFGISDTGVGMSKTKLHDIFSSLISQTESDFDFGHQGGVSLAVTKQLVELMGGEIDVEPADTHGASFAFTVPARVKEAALNSAFDIAPISVFDDPSFESRNPHVWDRDELLQRLGGDTGILSHLKALFDSTTPERILLLRQASVRRDWETLEKISHELKGVAQNLIMPEFLNALQDLRTSIKERAPETNLARKMAVVGIAFEAAQKQKV
jgi:signal transduction histidine kinase